jgi:hypothetical protein
MDNNNYDMNTYYVVHIINELKWPARIRYGLSFTIHPIQRVVVFMTSFFVDRRQPFIIIKEEEEEGIMKFLFL